ncbi:hypothetical protein TWF696_001320 [Orbilia brochopaga]|uniref:Uncharacterized protein n=1 Tax=Orbilia brochopaga TaxID=3140254 RepID=A0AAV9UB27_9PEZI
MSDLNNVDFENFTEFLENDETSHFIADGTSAPDDQDHPFEWVKRFSTETLQTSLLQDQLAACTEDAPYDFEAGSQYATPQEVLSEAQDPTFLDSGASAQSLLFCDDQPYFTPAYTCDNSIEPDSYILDQRLEPTSSSSNFPPYIFDGQPSELYSAPLQGLPFPDLGFPPDFDLESETQRLLDNWSDADNYNLAGIAYEDAPQLMDKGKDVDWNFQGQPIYQYLPYNPDFDIPGINTLASSHAGPHWLAEHSPFESPLPSGPIEPEPELEMSRIESTYIDSDATIDLEEAGMQSDLRSSRAVSTIGDYLVKMTVPPKERHGISSDPNDPIEPHSGPIKPQKPKRKAPKRKSAGSSTALADGDAAEDSQPKRGRGRPIVPGSLRQRRLQAMAQPDYVPPKRGRPRTSDRHLKKRSHRAKTAKVTSQPSGEAATANEGTFMQQEADSFAYDDDEIRYKPIYFILSAAQALKIQQLYNVPAPKEGWANQDRRWQITYNLQRVSPTGSFLIRELTDRYQKAQRSALIGAKVIDKENQVPAYPQDHDASPDDCIITEWRAYPSPQKLPLSANENCERPRGYCFPDQRLTIATGDANGPRAMTQPEVLHKLLDERDVYFRAIIWEILKGSSAVAEMNFVGTMNRMMGTWEFV